MNPWSFQVSAQIVERMQREGVEVVESPFAREWQPGPVLRLIIGVWHALRNRSNQQPIKAIQPKQIA